MSLDTEQESNRYKKNGVHSCAQLDYPSTNSSCQTHIDDGLSSSANSPSRQKSISPRSDSCSVRNISDITSSNDIEGLDTSKNAQVTKIVRTIENMPALRIEKQTSTRA
ncbi:hypothetical protein OnM2_004035 [Erysiphe neolycopersici]|uniref:Uncharacterized protein n=1 Tax=Erysiphe neolycopersici TaxID=212602 RepID=A0A420I7M8_9PEZI|nr:hypothetical protein OnM2_004035 [Erysiphe neolycopersici]